MEKTETSERTNSTFVENRQGTKVENFVSFSPKKIEVMDLKTKNINSEAKSNPIVQRAFERLKESQDKDNHVCHYTKHSSHSTHSKGSW